MTTPAAAPPAKPKTPHGTAYVVLKRTDDGKSFTPVDTITTLSAHKAIRIYADRNGVKTGTFVAVPARNWLPVPITVETKTTIKLG